jgi:hypothetical protein
VDELARAAALVADSRLKPDSAEPAHALSPQHRRDRRERHLQHLCDLRPGHPQTSQGDDDVDTILRRPIRNQPWRRRAISEPAVTLSPESADPFARTAKTDAGSLRRRRDRPTLFEHPAGEQPPPLHAEGRVTVKLHPVSSL